MNINNKVGMYGGKFLPLTQGHVNCIIEASTYVEELYIILSYHPIVEESYFDNAAIDYVSYNIRYRWLTQLTKDMPNVKILPVCETYNHVNKEYIWSKGANDIRKAIGKPIDIVFFGGDYEFDTWREIYPEVNTFIRFDRTPEDISATKIRTEGAYKHWDMIPDVCKPYYAKKVCVVGTESCGKSTLVRNLATVYNTNYVHEYGRDVCEAAGGELNMDLDDYVDILCGQVTLEKEAIKKSNKLLFVDSEQVVTQYYLRMNKHKGDREIAVRRLAKMISSLQKYDLVLLMAPSVPWINDGTRIHGNQEERNKNHEIIKTMYDIAGINYIEITADNYTDRYNECRRHIDNLLEV